METITFWMIGTTAATLLALTALIVHVIHSVQRDYARERRPSAPGCSRPM